MCYVTVHRTHQTIAVAPMVEGIYSGQWKCFAMMFTGFFSPQVFLSFLQNQPSFPLAEAVPLYFCSVILLTFLVPCLIFSISSASNLSFLDLGSPVYLQFDAVSLSSSQYLLQLTCSSSPICWIPVPRFIQVFSKYSMHFRYRHLY